MPQSQEAEQAVLGAIFAQSDCLNKIIELLPNSNYFYRPAHQIIYDAILKLYDRNEAIDPLTVSEYLQNKDQLEEIGGRYYLGLLLSHSPLAINAERYAQIVMEKFLLREIIFTGNQIAKIGYEEAQAEKAIERSEQLVFNLGQKRASQTLTPISNLVNSTWERLEQREQNKGELLGLDTGFYDLNALTSGLQRSDLIVIAARPSMGKTALCLNIAEYVGVVHKKIVAMFSMEMSKEQIIQRMVCSRAAVDANKMRFGQLQQDDWTKLGIAFGDLGDAQIYIDDTAVLNVMEIKAKARRLKAELGDLGLIIIDYLQLMEGQRPDNRVQEISDISRGLKALARELDVPVISISQLSRAVEARQNKRPMLSDLRESGSIEQDADIVMFIYRDEYYNPETPNKGETEVIIAKQRNGPTGRITLLFQPNITKFRNPARTFV
ncbi:MAG: replicative DNA helicase [Candidatus Melainabacteria bacterium RIFCSPLOWO2_02_FULL_35_15]|nr:MAG: replicative DNA helicase [Candidatus Melainabacteria bacterium RIFCSPLOWO2_12_FULL_35_11]OGI13697.1 MAG: replicative DNA helicase [Candidatus Melainabacteria bacterium RIFCSPLOWO2_02_FULL_35_15]